MNHPQTEMFDPEPERQKILPAFFNAYRAGRDAARHGFRRMPPYGRGGWGDNYRHYWEQGYDDQKKCASERYEPKTK